MTAAFFQFETPFVDTMRCLPMIVRFKLDRVGIKLSLRAWSRLPVAARARLVVLPADSTQELAIYQRFLIHALESIGEPLIRLAEPQPMDWMYAADWPESVTRKMEALHVILDDRSRWSQLSTLQRFTLVKLTRDGQESTHFLLALREFGLLPYTPLPS